MFGDVLGWVPTSFEHILIFACCEQNQLSSLEAGFLKFLGLDCDFKGHHDNSTVNAVQAKFIAHILDFDPNSVPSQSVIIPTGTAKKVENILDSSKLSLEQKKAKLSDPTDSGKVTVATHVIPASKAGGILPSQGVIAGQVQLLTKYLMDKDPEAKLLFHAVPLGPESNSRARTFAAPIEAINRILASDDHDQSPLAVYKELLADITGAASASDNLHHSLADTTDAAPAPLAPRPVEAPSMIKTTTGMPQPNQAAFAVTPVVEAQSPVSLGMSPARIVDENRVLEEALGGALQAMDEDLCIADFWAIPEDEVPSFDLECFAEVAFVHGNTPRVTEPAPAPAPVVAKHSPRRLFTSAVGANAYKPVPWTHKVIDLCDSDDKFVDAVVATNKKKREASAPVAEFDPRKGGKRPAGKQPVASEGLIYDDDVLSTKDATLLVRGLVAAKRLDKAKFDDAVKILTDASRVAVRKYNVDDPVVRDIYFKVGRALPHQEQLEFV